MATQRIDHINIRIPEDGVETALEFYVDTLGFEPLKLDAFTADERTSFFVRIGDTSVINIRPVDTFEEPTGDNLDHFCIILADSLEEIKRRLAEAGIEPLREGTPFGATGRGPSVYITDPFGYVIELKESPEI